MNYMTAKNDRRRRRKARVITTLITLTIAAFTAYTLGAFDVFLEAEPEPVEQVIAASGGRA